MSESDRIQFVIIGWCIVAVYLLVVFRRHVIFWLFQAMTLLILFSGMMFCISGLFSSRPAWLAEIDNVLVVLLEPLPRAAGVLVFAMLMFGGIPLALLFRTGCFWLFPWLRLFGLSPEERDAMLASGVRLSRRGFDPSGKRFLVPHAIGLGTSIVVILPLLVLSINGNETATRFLKMASAIALLLFFLAISEITGRGGDR
ncbi:MAG: hypothetical protein DWQ35_15875 [Planctomycetota bacterium]|nr:MAG: hypothetical protein DWQ35_15875 [Planctomycetota bacterium]REK18289.1 MAG: hypothetical protein DWQ42_20640 [Planctomycetota bacterium]REK49159.1 MAG: hypothetical protein DWQ46_01240 [Planctomycetota bacterium]